MRTVAILPVKSFSQAKQRLRSELSPELRRSLVEAMLGDVLAALAECRSVDRVLVVSPDERARQLAEQAGALTLADPEAGHNEAATAGIEAALREHADRVALVPGDCPALDPLELDGLLTETETGTGTGTDARTVPVPDAIVIPDRHGTGTNALILTPPDALAPSFGPGSCARHLEHAAHAGVSCRVVALPSLALDVDTPEDLDALAASGRRATRTLELLARC
jgi:2-phospho-L-lactate guanylyltransferase